MIIVSGQRWSLVNEDTRAHTHTLKTINRDLKQCTGKYMLAATVYTDQTWAEISETRHTRSKSIEYDDGNVNGAVTMDVEHSHHSHYQHTGSNCQELRTNSCNHDNNIQQHFPHSWTAGEQLITAMSELSHQANYDPICTR